MNIVPFKFEENSIRVIADDSGETWFVGKDICEVLGYRNVADAITRHCKGVVKRYPLQTTGGMQEVRVLAEPDVLRLIINSRLPAAAAFERWVFEEVLPAIRRTGRYDVSEQTPVFTSANPAAQAIQIADALATMLRVSNSGRLSMARQAISLHSPENLSLVPAYAIDAPSDSVAGSSEPTHSASYLLREHGLTISAQAFNLLAEEAGYLETITRQGSHGQIKRFKSVTESGLRYGKNVSSPQCPRETNPHWYDSRFEDLLDMLNIE